VKSPVASGLADDPPIRSASPTRSAVDKTNRFSSLFSLVSYHSPVHCTITITLYLEARLPTTFLTQRTATTDGPARPGHTSEPAEDRDRPAVQRASEPTARSAGGSPPKPRTGDVRHPEALEPRSPEPGICTKQECPPVGDSRAATGGSEQAGRNLAQCAAARNSPELGEWAPERSAISEHGFTSGATSRSGAPERASAPPGPVRRRPLRTARGRQPAAPACRRPGRASARADRREAPHQRCCAVLSRWSLVLSRLSMTNRTPPSAAATGGVPRV